ncbi:MAG TPA: hypothetical protein VM187_02475, partial [Niastella sp.]|nr:hypothetical protein [Niastella sp.]
PGAKWQQLYEDRAIYTNISSNRLLDLIDGATGRKIGQLGAGIQPGATMLFGGKQRRVVNKLANKIVVEPVNNEYRLGMPMLTTGFAALTHDLARAIAEEMAIPQLTINAQEQGMPAEDDNTAQYQLFHCAGEAYGLVLAELLKEQAGVKVAGYNGLILFLRGPLVRELYLQPQQLCSKVHRRWQQLEQLFDLGSFQPQLPRDMRLAAVMAAFNVEEFMRFFSERSLKVVIDAGNNYYYIKMARS